jgi:hypothetical protein
MKFIKIATTISFMIVFAFVAINYDHLYSNTVTTVKKPKAKLGEAVAPAPAPIPDTNMYKTVPEPLKPKSPGGRVMGEVNDGPGFKSMPKKESKPAPDVYKSDPPAPRPLAAPEVVVITSKLEYNEYVKGAGGAAVGWAVKEICAWFFGLAKSLLRRRFA